MRDELGTMNERIKRAGGKLSLAEGRNFLGLVNRLRWAGAKFPWAGTRFLWASNKLCWAGKGITLGL